MADAADVTALLRAWAGGQSGAADRLVPVIYQQLRRRAAAYLRGERRNHSLQPTALVNEAYLRLVDQRGVAWKNRAQFFGVAAQMMRRILVDHARRRNMNKRSGQWLRVSLDDHARPGRTADFDVLALDQLLDRLAESIRARAVLSKCGISAASRSRKPPSCSTSRRGPSSESGAPRARGCTAAQDRRRAAEGRLRIHHPVGFEERSDEGVPLHRVAQGLGSAREVEFVPVVRAA